MALTESTMLALGSTAPSFSLPDFDDRVHTLDAEQKPSVGCNIKWRSG